MRRTHRKGRWTTADATDLYGIGGWGRDYFTVDSQGHLLMRPRGEGQPSIDVKELVDEVAERGIQLPLLIRFSDLVERRIEEIHGAFQRAIESYEYGGGYRGVYPIKVNQNRFLVEELVRSGRPYHYGLEAGSKPELMAVMALLDDLQVTRRDGSVRRLLNRTPRWP